MPESSFKFSKAFSGVQARLLAKLFETSTGHSHNGTDSRQLATGALANGAVTAAKMALFVSTEQTGNGSAQNIAHGLGAVPSKVLIVPTDTAPATTGVYTATEGAHDSTNVVVTVTSGKKYKVLAIA